MFKKYSTEFAIIAVGLISAVTTTFNNESNLSATKAETDKYTALESKVDNLTNKLDALINKSETISFSENINLDSVKEASLLPINSLDLEASFSISIILFVIAALSALIGLLVNFYINKHGKEWNNQVPTFLKPLINYYLKITPYTGYINMVIIGICLLFILLVAIYMKFRGIA